MRSKPAIAAAARELLGKGLTISAVARALRVSRYSVRQAIATATTPLPPPRPGAPVIYTASYFLHQFGERFSLSDFCNVTRLNRRAAAATLLRLRRRGVLTLVKRGVYAVAHPAHPDPDPAGQSPPVSVASQ